MRIIGDNLFFFRKECVFSHFHESEFEFFGEKMRYGEEAIQMSKADLYGDRDSFKAIHEATTPGKMKQLGSQVKGYQENKQLWIDNAERICYDVNRARYSQDESARAELTKYKSYKFYEASPHDRLFGIGYSLNFRDLMKNVDNFGDNILGKCLNKLIDEYDLV